jgi:hypothetical protein
MPGGRAYLRLQWVERRDLAVRAGRATIGRGHATERQEAT